VLRAVDSRDARFDGWFVTCVTSTRIYCRPSCPAMTPKRKMYGSCRRPRGAARRVPCLPALPPDARARLADWNYRADVVVGLCD